MVNIRSFLSILLLFALVGACSPQVEENKPITLGLNAWPGYAFVFIAKEKGFFEKNKVNVQLAIHKDISVSAERYRNGELDGILDVLSDVILFNAEGIDAKVVYILDYSTSGDVVIGRSELNSVADLKGKKVGFEGINSFSHIFVLRSLEKAGLKETDLQFKNILAMDVFTALEKGEIDAGHTWEPVTTKALKKGYKILGKASDVPGSITDVLALNSKIIREKPEAVRNLVKSLLEARDFLFSNREEALEIMSKALGMNREELEEGLGGVNIPNLQENLEAMQKTTSEPSLHRSGEFIIEFLFNRGQLLQRIDMDLIIEPRFVRSLSEEKGE